MGFRGLMVGLCVVAMVAMSAEAVLTPDFYAESCPQVFSIVQEQVAKAVAANVRNAASLVRLHFHDCFVNGCDGSLLLDNTTDGYVSEKFAPANNNSARAFPVVDAIKAALEAACPQTVSCADILAIASRDSAVAAGLPPYTVLLGRRDSLPTQGDFSFLLAKHFLPSPGYTYAQLKENFENVTLDELDLVALSGAHTIGRVRCEIVQGFGLFNSVETNPAFREFLNTTLCPPGSVALTDLDLPSPDTFDSSYYQNLRRGEGMFRSDQTLQDTPGVNQEYVASFALNQSAFFNVFAASTIKMGNISPLEGDDGEIRLNCRMQNNPPNADPRISIQ
jgi:peroxidase